MDKLITRVRRKTIFCKQNFFFLFFFDVYLFRIHYHDDLEINKKKIMMPGFIFWSLFSCLFFVLLIYFVQWHIDSSHQIDKRMNACHDFFLCSHHFSSLYACVCDEFSVSSSCMSIDFVCQLRLKRRQ